MKHPFYQVIIEDDDYSRTLELSNEPKVGSILKLDWITNEELESFTISVVIGNIIFLVRG